MTRNPDYKRLHNGRRYLTAVKEMFDHYGTVCHLCGHDGADSADYLVPVSVDPYQDEGDPHNKRPAHGIKGCSTCGKKCNQSRGDRPITQTLRTSQSW